MTTVRVPRPTSLPPAGDRLVVVEASAGTGKTFFLEHRVVDLILAGAELGQLLLVTFTDKAVAELRMRIRDLLDRLSRADGSTGDTGADLDPATSWALDADARKRLRAAVTAFDHAPIFTIHGFCNRLLVEDAFAARRLFDQTQVADEVAFDAAFASLLRERFAKDRPDRDLLAAYLETDHTVDDLRALLLRCARADAPVRHTLDPEVLRAAGRTVRAELDGEARRGALLAAITNGTSRNYVATRFDRVVPVLAALDLDGPPSHVLAALEELRTPLTELADRLDDLAVDVPGSAGLRSALRAAVSTGTLGEALASELLPQILARIGLDKAEHGLFDYDDMLELVWEALRGERGGELATRLRTRMPWAMIDEFQDTDAVQWGIFRTVWLHAEARGLTIVGDPKQAIYGFRGADVQTYLAAREEMLAAGATRVALTVNRRSTRPLVDAVNHLLVGTLGMPMLDKGGISYDEPVSASGDIVEGAPHAPVQVLALTTKGTAEQIRTALATAIGDEIEALRAAPPAWTTRGVAPAFTLGQVLVLTRGNKDSIEIAAALRARGLPCALVEPERLFETREAAELVAVLAAIAAPRDRSARLRALRTRFFDVPWTELARVVDAPDHHPSIAQLFEWAQLAGRRAYETLFRRLVEDSRFAERALVLGNGERTLTNTWHLIELLLEEVARARSDLHELVGQLRRWITDDGSPADERDVQRAETDLEAIRILTIHKAKGLEAPYVFLFGGTQPPPASPVHTLRDGAGRALIVGAPDAPTKEALEAATEAENQRLAYVALTRAQVRLYLPLYADAPARPPAKGGKAKPASKGPLTRTAAYFPIQRALTASLASRVAHPAVWFEEHAVDLGAAELPPPPDDALAALAAPAPPAMPELVPLPAARGGLQLLSYTRLAADLAVAALAARPGDVLALDPAEFDIDDTAGEVGPDELPPGASAGLLLHDVLEIADLDLARATPDPVAWAAAPAVRAQLTTAARARGIDARYHTHAATVLHRTLTAPLALTTGELLAPLVAATALAREVEFAYPLPAGAARPGLVRGFIDVLVAYDDELWVLDYKSDLLAGDDLAVAAARRVRDHYAVQARLYAIAADRLRGPRRLAGLLFAFVRHGLVVPVRLADDSVPTWTAWLAALPAPRALEGRP